MSFFVCLQKMVRKATFKVYNIAGFLGEPWHHHIFWWAFIMLWLWGANRLRRCGPITAVLSARPQHEITFLRFLCVVSSDVIAMTYVWHMLEGYREQWWAWICCEKGRNQMLLFIRILQCSAREQMCWGIAQKDILFRCECVSARNDSDPDVRRMQGKNPAFGSELVSAGAVEFYSSRKWKSNQNWSKCT